MQWLWYAVGGRLPASLNEWVLRDVTAHSWVWRHIAQLSVILVPFAAACLLVPGPLALRVGMLLLLLIVGTFYSVAYLEDNADRRAIRQGYPEGAAKAIREARHEHEEAEAGIQDRYEASFR